MQNISFRLSFRENLIWGKTLWIFFSCFHLSLNSYVFLWSNQTIILIFFFSIMYVKLDTIKIMCFSCFFIFSVLHFKRPFILTLFQNIIISNFYPKLNFLSPTVFIEKSINDVHLVSQTLLSFQYTRSNLE